MSRIQIARFAKAAATVTALGATASAAIASGPAATAAGSSTVQLANTTAGKILVTSHHDTLYMFSHDKHGKNTCDAIANCAMTWPAYTTRSKPTAGPGLKKSLLGTVNIGHGRKQVTYAGHPLYRYAFDSGPESTSYIGAHQFGGVWDALSAAGKAVK